MAPTAESRGERVWGVRSRASARAERPAARDRDAMARTAFIDAGAEDAISRPPGSTYQRPPPQKKRPSSSSSKKKKKKGRLDPPPPPPTEDDLALRARLVEAAAKPTPPSAELAAAAPAPAARGGNALRRCLLSGQARVLSRGGGFLCAQIGLLFHQSDNHARPIL